MAGNYSREDGHPILELLYSAEIFGAGFEKPGKSSQLKRSVENATHLHLTALHCVRLIKRLTRGVRRSDVARAIKWLTTIQEDFGVIEENARKALQRAKLRGR